MRNRRLLISLMFACTLVSCRNLPAPTLAQIDQSTQAPKVDNVVPGAVVELWADTGSGLSLIATSSAVGATPTVRVRLPNRLSPGQKARTRQKRWFFQSSPFSNVITVENNYVTNRYDNQRSGWNPSESTLTVSNVRNRLVKVCEHNLGAAIRGQPLYVENVEIKDKGRHNVVFVTTEEDKIWAFDADSCVPNDPGLWFRDLLNAGESVPGMGNVPAKCGLKYGIWSTPAIDRTTNTMYVVAAVGQGSNNIFFRLHAINIETGADQTLQNGQPAQAKIDGTIQYAGSPATFDGSVQQNRPGLLLDRGVLYLGFGSCGDVGSPYHGWVLAYDTDIPNSATFLKQVGVFNTSPQETGGCFNIPAVPPCFAGVWQAGLGLAADDDGTVYFVTGNGHFDATRGWFGNTLFRLRLPPAGAAGNQMQVVSSFTPYDWASTYELGDKDFGAGGPVLFSNNARHFILAGGKPSKSYLIDRDCTNCNGSPNRCNTAGAPNCPGDDPNLVLQTLTPTPPQGTVAGPAYYTGSQGTKIYYGYNYIPITAFDFQPNPPQILNPQLAPDHAPVTAPIPTVSSKGSSPGTAIVWGVFQADISLPAGSQILTLHAYDADDVTDNLFSGRPQQSLDVAPWVYGQFGNSFQVPTVIHGKVYSGSQDRLVIFGLRHRRHCWFVVDCGGSVTFRCEREDDSEQLQLERRQSGVWKNVTNADSTRDFPKFSQMWDYPGADTAVYRVCSKRQPEDCTQEFTVKVPHIPCGIDQCGRPGKPPCFLDRPWPVSRGEELKKSPPGRE